MTDLHFYFDFISPYAYFAALDLPELCRRHDATLRYHPVVFAGLLNHWGQLGPAEIPPKAMHTLRTTVRHARSRGIPFKPPRFHPYRPITSLRLALHEVCGDAQAAVVEAIFKAGWGGGIDLGSAADLAACLSEAGMDGADLVERTGSDEAKAALIRETETAISRGVFGVPSFWLETDDGPELLWGHDMLNQLEAVLAGEDPLKGVDWREIANEGPAVVRKRP
ncbi:MAG: 2-hydroxychromene-2-carboxylate isomerase [Myxococcales bacterium]|nr:2-hydroxychromene-2-carboxylate isomerase [Myxococcales bacterium]